MEKKYKLAKGGKHSVAKISDYPKRKRYHKAAEGIVNQQASAPAQQQPASGDAGQGAGQQQAAPMIIVQAALAFNGQTQPLGGPMQLKSKEDIPKVAQMLEQAFAQVEKATSGQGAAQGGGTGAALGSGQQQPAAT